MAFQVPTRTTTDGTISELQPARSVPHTGEKKRKIVSPPSPPLSLSSSPSDDATDGGPQVQEHHQGGQKSDESIFSAQDDISYEEQSLCYEELRWRESLYYINRDLRIRFQQDEVYERLCRHRWRDYKILVRDGLINPGDTTGTLAPNEDDEVCPWDSPFEPGPSLFGWTYDPQYFDLADLDDYQRILPTIVDFFEYPSWEEYRLTFSNYETDKEYVKYCDKISKQIKWVEEYMRLDYKEFVKNFKRRGLKQAMKIANVKDFSHLTYCLTERGYNEYIFDMRYDIDIKDYIHVFFVLWKRVHKQEMNFEDALKLDLPKATFYLSSGSRIEGQLKGHNNMMRDEFETCMSTIPTHFVDDDEAFRHITDVVYKIKSGERPKRYLDYVKKKLEVAQRLQLCPATPVSTECPKG